MNETGQNFNGAMNNFIGSTLAAINPTRNVESLPLSNIDRCRPAMFMIEQEPLSFYARTTNTQKSSTLVKLLVSNDERTFSKHFVTFELPSHRNFVTVGEYKRCIRFWRRSLPSSYTRFSVAKISRWHRKVKRLKFLNLLRNMLPFMPIVPKLKDWFKPNCIKD